MKPKLCSLLATLLFFTCSFAQSDSALLALLKKVDGVTAKAKKFSDSAGNDLILMGDAGQQLSIGTYKKYLDNYFTYLAYDRGALPTGNLASLDLKDNNTSLTLTVSKKFEPEKFNKRLLIELSNVF